jgi:hypothetical protein
MLATASRINGSTYWAFTGQPRAGSVLTTSVAPAAETPLLVRNGRPRGELLAGVPNVDADIFVSTSSSTSPSIHGPGSKAAVAQFSAWARANGLYERRPGPAACQRQRFIRWPVIILRSTSAVATCIAVESSAGISSGNLRAIKTRISCSGMPAAIRRLISLATGTVSVIGASPQSYACISGSQKPLATAQIGCLSFKPPTGQAAEPPSPRHWITTHPTIRRNRCSVGSLRRDTLIRSDRRPGCCRNLMA